MKNKNKKHFFLWYYTEGLGLFWRSATQLLFFIPRLFSMDLLLRTLVSPWHRDVSLKDWSGFDPVRIGGMLFWNVFSRIIGAIVRTSFLLVAIVLWALLGAVIVFLTVVYFAFPAIAMLVFVFAAASQWLLAAVLLAGMMIIMLWAYNAFHHSSVIPYAKMDILSLAREPWFQRVWARIGVDPQDVPPGILGNISAFEEYLRGHNISLEEAEYVIEWEMQRQIEREKKARPFDLDNLHKMRPIGLDWHYGYTVQLNTFSHDLSVVDNSAYARAPFYGHAREYDMLEMVLARPSGNNALIIGDPGIGRHMLVHELARRIRTGYYNGTGFMSMRVLQADLSSAVAHAIDRGTDPEYAVENYFHEAAYAGNVILFLENFAQYTESHRDFSYPALIERYAGLPSFRIIALATEEEYHTHIRDHEAMVQHFDIIHMEEMSPQIAMHTLFTLFYHSERTVFTLQALREIIDASERYMNTGPLPSRAIALATAVEQSWENAGGTGMIHPEDVHAYVTKKTGIPVGTITEDEQDRLLSLEDEFHKDIIGQEEAVRVVAQAVRRMRSGMARGGRPAGSFLFLGPTGVGKTEMAKTLARHYFGSLDRVTRLDMSEFQGPEALARLIGSRESREKGRLTEIVSENPYTVLLLDEIEKAESRVLDVFLQVLDEGFAHNAYGKKLHFTNMIIIATTNAGSDKILGLIEQEKSPSEMKEAIQEAVTATHTFRPEFLNRFDDTVIFHPIPDADVPAIVRLMLDKFAARTEREQNIRVVFADDVIPVIVERGFDQRFGARSLLRYIDESVADALAKKLIRGNIHRGEDMLFTVADMEG